VQRTPLSRALSLSRRDTNGSITENIQQKLLIAEHLTLSALYTVPIPEVCALPRGLDTHFVALLQSLTREQLWARLRQEYRTMDEHVQEMENYTTQFAKLLESIYKYVCPLRERGLSPI
jgi:hypothetical protein